MYPLAYLHKNLTEKDSTKISTLYGENIDVADLRQQTLKCPDQVISQNVNGNRITLYKKEFVDVNNNPINISTTDTPTSHHRVIINEANPAKSSQFPWLPPNK